MKILMDVLWIVVSIIIVIGIIITNIQYYKDRKESKKTRKLLEKMYKDKNNE